MPQVFVTTQYLGKVVLFFGLAQKVEEQRPEGQNPPFG